MADETQNKNKIFKNIGKDLLIIINLSLIK